MLVNLLFKSKNDFLMPELYDNAFKLLLKGENRLLVLIIQQAKWCYSTFHRVISARVFNFYEFPLSLAERERKEIVAY